MRVWLLGVALLLAGQVHGTRLATLYGRLDSHSIPQQLAFYQLYPDSEEGQRALAQAWRLLGGRAPEADLSSLGTELHPLLLLVDRFARPEVELGAELPEQELRLIEELSSHLPNRSLAGHHVWSVEELLKLPVEEVDLARGLLLTFLGEEHRQQIRSYEALLDLMVLQVLAHLQPKATAQEKIDAINQLLFFELGLRFPPQSRFAQEIDVYTFLPSVLDKRRGVCLGVSSLYLCLAQRLELSLEAITPPGHIFVRYKQGDQLINIETTNRGIHLPSEEYLGMQAKSLQPRNIKEVIGLTFMNQGAALWQANQHEDAVAAYKRALQFLPDDPLTHEFLGYNLLALGELEEGSYCLERACQLPSPHMLSSSSAAQDLLHNRADLEGIEAVFMQVDETRQSILDKQKRLHLSLERHPDFRAGWFHLGVTWLQLGREQEALEALNRFHALDTDDPVAEYYLAAVNLGRRDYQRAWDHLKRAEELAQEESCSPRPLRELRRALKIACPQ